MRVKRYLVDTMPEAMQQIRSELGQDAVILGSKEIRVGGMLGLFRKKKMEVIAAVEQKVQHPPFSSKPEMSPTNALHGYGALKAYTSQSTGQQQVMTKPVQPSRPVVAENPDMPRSNADVIHSNSENEKLYEEIKQMKEMVVRLSNQHNQDGESLPAVFKQLKQVLISQEIDPNHVEQLILETMESIEKKDEITLEEAVERLKDQLRKYFNAERITGIQNDTKIVHIVGPTGVGKTTTIAKLAAEQVLKHRRKVGFITSDTYRIAAVDQLKTYANILGVPLEVVFSPHELNRAFQELSDCEVIFMDTAGRNFRNEMYVSELNSLLSSSEKSETYLVLSLTTRYKDMKAITENFSRFKLDKVLFTKGDETTTYGALINLAIDYPLTFSYITDGQNVPDDIDLIDVEYWLDRLLEVDTND